MTIKNPQALNGAALAYLGDGIYEVYIRQYLIGQGYTKVNELHQKAKSYVSAHAQASVIDQWLLENSLTDDEWGIYKRGRNAKTYTKPKNTDQATYSKSTGFEAIFGYLYLTGQNERVSELVEHAIYLSEQSPKTNT